MEPAIISASPRLGDRPQETFAPIVYVLKCKSVDEAIAINNEVEQGLSSSIYEGPRKCFKWMGPKGQIAELVNVIPTSRQRSAEHLEERATGAAESGSDAWKQYMKRHHLHHHYSKKTPGIRVSSLSKFQESKI